MAWDRHKTSLYLHRLASKDACTDHHYVQFHDNIPDYLLEERKTQFEKVFKKQKSLLKLYSKHQRIIKRYCKTCISFHSSLEIVNLITNMDELIDKKSIKYKNFNEATVKDKLKTIKISVDCSIKLTQCDSESFDTYNSTQNYIPSIENITSDNCGGLLDIDSLLKSQRWIVILGDPGSSKTTSLRWITYILAKAVLTRAYKHYFAKNNYLRVRIPILIRISEFAEWHEQNSAKTLFDYIGQQTWFSKSYFDNDDGTVLKDFIYHGHSLILLDGLDEVFNIGQRQKVVELIKDFIDNYVRAPDFFSPFDYEKFQSKNVVDPKKKISQIPSPDDASGNQIVITSRIAGYQLYPITSPSIKHYMLLPMNQEQANKYMEALMCKVKESLNNTLLNEGIKFTKDKIDIFWRRRFNAVKNFIDNGSTTLTTNSSLLSLIFTSIIQSSNEYYPKSRIEVYHYTIQSTLDTWLEQQSNISKECLNDILIDLANYLHMNSPSGLIDAFDIEDLSRRSLHRYNVSSNYSKILDDTRTFLSLLKSNKGIVNELGLFSFGFLHLSYQEYFVARSFVNGSSIEHIAQRILSFIIHPRFRESLVLAFGWISWKWTLDDYDKFCKIIFSPNENYVMPYGILIFFDAISELQKLPSFTIIEFALNYLLDHISIVITRTYLIRNLLKLPEDIIEKWMQKNLNDEKRSLKFCQCILKNTAKLKHIDCIDPKLIPAVIYQKLWSFHHLSIQVEFAVDQVLRKTLISSNSSNSIFNQEFSSFFSSKKISSSKIHPLILSVIISVCGGITFNYDNNIQMISFSPKHLHRPSSVLFSIIKYFSNEKDNHFGKTQLLIKDYQTFLENSNPEDISSDIVDTLTALICLQGLSQPLIYQRYDKYRSLPLALDRLKRTWFYLNEFLRTLDNGLFVKGKEFRTIFKTFFSQHRQSDEENILFLSAFVSTCKKLNILLFSHWFEIPNLRMRNIFQYLEYQSEFGHPSNEQILDQIKKNIHPYQLLKNQLFFLCTFVPQSLQMLYHYLIDNSTNDVNSFPLVILVVQNLLLLFDDSYFNDMNLYLILFNLQSLYKEHYLEHFALVLFWKNKYVNSHRELAREKVFEAIKDHITIDQSYIDQPKDWTSHIGIEYQRINQAKQSKENKHRDEQLFSALICLVRLLQAQHDLQQYQDSRIIYFSTLDIEEIYSELMNICDPVLRIIAQGIILDIIRQFNFEEQTDELELNMINSFLSIITNLSLPLATLLFIQCYSVHRLFPISFNYISNIIGKKLIEIAHNQLREQTEAVYIALQKLNDPDLLPYLHEFERKTANLSDLLHLNSSIFFRYFTDTKSFYSSNCILLSVMYIAELAFDCQILKMYSLDNQMNNILCLEDLTEIWNQSSKDKREITFQAATAITNYLQIATEEDLHKIISDLTRCSTIRKKALPVIKCWLKYQDDRHLQSFSCYTALQLLIHDEYNSNLISIITKNLDIKKNNFLPNLLEQLVNSERVTQTTINEILVKLYTNMNSSLEKLMYIWNKNTLQSVLNFEFEQTQSHINQSSQYVRISYLLLFKGCSDDLKIYLIEHLHKFINTGNDLINSVKEQYVCTVLRWIILSLNQDDISEKTTLQLCPLIFQLSNDAIFPQISKVSFDAFYLLIISMHVNEKNSFTISQIFDYVEKVIQFYVKYSQDILSICLLIYGNLLIKSKKLSKSQNISDDDIIKVLKQLFQKSSSQIIRIRSAFCLMIVKRQQRSSETIINWFRNNKWNLSEKKIYNIWLQQTLYQGMINFPPGFEKDDFKMDEIVKCITTHSDVLMKIFIDEFLNYLRKQSNSNCSMDSEPDYIRIVEILVSEHGHLFIRYMEESSFSKKEFQEELYRYYKLSRKNSNKILEILFSLGELTVELVDMLKENEPTPLNRFIITYLKRIKQLSDRETIERIFQQLDSLSEMSNFTLPVSQLKLLVQLVRNDIVSLQEVHQHTSSITKKLLLNKYLGFDDEQKIIDILLDLTCLENEVKKQRILIISEVDENEVKKQLNLTVNTIDVTENYIDNYFKNQIRSNNVHSNCFLRRNIFLKNFQFMANHLH